MRFLKVLCVLALVLMFAGAAYAETQSVKVSGDLTIRGLYRDRYDYLPKAQETETNPRTGRTSTTQDWFMSTTEVQVDADLTDNVQTVIRLLNQRDWNVSTKSVEATEGSVNNGTATTLATNGRGGYTANADEFDVGVELAYVQLKDFIYSPLTLTIGRQNLWFGKGFIVGLNLQNPNNTIAAGEYTAMTAFDAVKAVLDYDPWTITGIYSKVFENVIQASDDVDLYGVNVGYKFNAYKGEAEGYWFYKKDNQVDKFWDGKNPGNNVHNIGIRGSFDPIDVITLAGEAVVQGGTYVGSRYQRAWRNRLAGALDGSLECRYWADKFTWKPKLGTEYIWYSGNENEANPAQATGTFTGFDGMYRGKFDSAIREFVGKFYASGRYGQQTDRLQSMPDASWTNQSQLIFLGSVQPMESVLLKANYNLFWNMAKYDVSDAKSNGFVGQEIDLVANWDYTEDVSFNLLAGWFIPGAVYDRKTNNTATDVVGSVKVSF
jgi:hypothetical protein